MVKIFKAPRTTKDQTLEQIKKVKSRVEPKSFIHTEEIERRHRYQNNKKLRKAIDINLAQRIETVKIEAKMDAEGTYFGEIIDLKRSADGSLNEKAYLYQVSQMSQSLPLVLHNLSNIIKTSLEYFIIGDKSCRLIILEIFPHLIKDCREEFYPYFKEVLQHFKDQINIEDVEILEGIFLLLAYGIKYLEKLLVQNFRDFINLFIDFFYLHKNRSVREISSQAISYLLKKVMSIFHHQHMKKGLVSQLINIGNEKRIASQPFEQNRIDEGLAFTLFQTMQGMNRYLMHNSLIHLSVIWNEGIVKYQLYDMFDKLGVLIIQNVSNKISTQNQDGLLLSLVEYFAFFQDLVIEDPQQYKCIVQLCINMINFNQSNKISQQIYKQIIKIVESYVHSQCDNEILRLIGALIRISLDKTDLQPFIQESAKIVDFVLETIQAPQLLDIINTLFEDKFGDGGLLLEVDVSKDVYQLLLASAIRILKSNLINHNEDINIFIIWSKLFKKEMSKLVPKDLSLIQTNGFNDLFMTNTTLDQISIQKQVAMSRFLQMVEIPNESKLILIGILKRNWSQLITKQLEQWNSIKSDVSQILHEERLKVSEYLLKQFNQDLLGQIRNLPFLLAENIGCRVKSQELNNIVALKNFVLISILQVGNVEDVEYCLEFENQFLSQVDYDQFTFYTYGQQKNITYQYDQTILQSKRRTSTYYNQLQRVGDICLSSRSRKRRLNCIQMNLLVDGIPEEMKQMFKVMEDIDSIETTLDNERNVKLQILKLRSFVKKYPTQVGDFTHGLAFNKFQLTRQSIVEIMTLQYDVYKDQSINEQKNNPFMRMTMSKYLTEYTHIVDAVIEDEHLFNEKFDYNSLDMEFVFENITLKAFTNATGYFGRTFKVFMLNYLKNIFHQKERQVVYDEDPIKCMENNIAEYKTAKFTKLDNKVLSSYLKVLNSVLQVAEESELWFQILHRLLVKEWLQPECLQCLETLEIQTQKSEYKELIADFFVSLKRISDGTTFRVELTQISLDLPDLVRAQFIKYLIYTIYPKIYSKQKLHKKMKGTYRAMEVRRNTVFEFLSQLGQNELTILFELVKQRHNLSDPLSFGAQQIMDYSLTLCREVPMQIQLQFLKTLTNLIDKIGFKINIEYLYQFSFYILSMYQEAHLIKKSSTALVSRAKELQKIANKLFMQIINKFTTNESEYEFTNDLRIILQTALDLSSYKQSFEKIFLDSQFQASGALKFLRTLSSLDTFHSVLIDNRDLILSQFCKLYEVKNYTKIEIEGDDQNEEVEGEDEKDLQNDDQNDDQNDELDSKQEPDGQYEGQLINQNEELKTKRKNKSKISLIQDVNAILQNILRIDDIKEAKIGKNTNEKQTDLQKAFCTYFGGSALQSLFLFFYQERISGVEILISIKDLKVLYIFHWLLQNINQLKIKLDENFLVRILEYFVGCLNHRLYANIVNTQEAKKTLSEIVVYSIKTILQILSRQSSHVEISQSQLDYFYRAYSILLLQQNIQIKLRSVSIEVLLLINKVFGRSQLDVGMLHSLQQMNVKNTSIINDELDYDECLKGCTSFQQQLTQATSNNQIHTANIVMQSLFFLLSAPELSIRLVVQEAVQTYFNVAATSHSEIQFKYIKEQFLPQMVTSLRVDDEQTLKVYVKFLEIYLRFTYKVKEYLCHEAQDFLNDFQDTSKIEKELKRVETYYSELYYIFFNAQNDEDQNVLHNLFDIQLTKRIRAITSLNKNINKFNLVHSKQSIKDIVIPLLEYVALNKTCNLQSRISDANRSHLQTMQHQSIELCGVLTKSFDWEDKVSILQDLTKNLISNMFQERKNEIKVQALIKMITAVAKNISIGINLMELIRQTKLNSVEPSQLELSLKSISKLYIQEETEEDADVQRARQNMMDLEDIPELDRISFKNLIKQEKNQAMVNSEGRSKTAYKDKFWHQICSLESNQEWINQTQPLLERVYYPIKNIYMMQSKQDQATTFQDKNTQQQQDKFRIQLAQILVELVVQFPPEIFMNELNRLVGRICRVLKSKDNELRDHGRQQLLMISSKVGSSFFHFILSTMKHTLNQGFENHVLNYTLNQMLNQIKEVGVVDYCLDDILELLLDEAFGKLSTEKELDNIPKKIKEMKNNKSLDSIQILAQYIDINISLPKLIGFIDNYLATQQISHQLQNKMYEIFQKIYNGLLLNSTLPITQPKEIISLIYVILAEFSVKVVEQLNLKHGIDFTIEPESKRTKRHDLDKTMTIQLPSQGPNSIMHFIAKNKLKTTQSLIFNQTTLLAIKLTSFLVTRHQKEFIECIQSDSYVEKIFSQIVKIIVDCMVTNEQELVSHSMTVLAILVRYPLKWIKNHKKTLVNNLLDYVTKLTSTDLQMVKDAFYLIRNLIESPTKELADFTPSQQKALLQFIHIQIENSKEIPIIEPLECLRTIVNKEWALPQIYDLVSQVKELMIQSNNKKTQSVSKQIFLQFLVKYPLSSNALQFNLDYLLANLNYPYPQGRQQVYKMFSSIFENFPDETIQKINEITFLSLIVTYIKEDHEESRNSIEKTLQAVIKTFTSEKTKRQVDNCLKWLSSESLKVKISGLESLKFLYQFSSPQGNQITLVLRLIIENVLDEWNQWKENISAQNIREQNLQSSQWQDDLEIQKVSQQPENDKLIQSLLGLLTQLIQSSPKILLELFDDDQSLCKIIKLTSYTIQKTANLAILFLDKMLSEESFNSYFLKQIQEKQTYLQENIFKILKYYFSIKYQRNTYIEQPEVTNNLISTFAIVLNQGQQYALIQEVFQSIANITQKHLMSKARQFKQALTNVAHLLHLTITKDFVKVINNQVTEIILELLMRMQRLTQILQCPELFETLEKTLQSFEKQMVQTVFIELYAKIQHKLDIARKQRKLGLKEKAITNPQEFAQEKIRKVANRKVSKQNKLLEFKGLNQNKRIKPS